MKNTFKCIFSIFSLFGFSTLINSQTFSLNDNIVWKGKINADEPLDKVLKSDTIGAIHVYISDSDSTYKHHVIDLQSYFPQEKFDSRKYLAVKVYDDKNGYLYFDLRKPPEYSDGRILKTGMVHITKFVDITTDRNDPDEIRDSCIHYINDFSMPFRTLSQPVDSFSSHNESFYRFTITRSLEEYHDEIKRGIYLKQTSHRIAAFYDKYPLSTLNVETYNNIGYYLQQNRRYNEALSVLYRITIEFPNRAVAHLNMADVYYNLDNFPEAKKSYENYIRLMKKRGKEAKIPKKVLERVKKNTNL